MTTPAQRPDDGAPPEGSGLLQTRDGKIVTVFGLATAAQLVCGLVFLGLAVVFSPIQDSLTEWQGYASAVPVLATAALGLMFVVLLLTTRKTWAMIGCAAAGVLVALTSYVLFEYVIGMSPVALGRLVLAGHLPIRAFFDYPLESLGDFVAITGVILSGGGLFLIPVAMVATVTKCLGALGRLPVVPPELAPRVRKVGTLRYTMFGLVVVFTWLLWGDFVHSLFDTHMPDILFLKLKDMGASDTLNAVLNKTIAYTVVFMFAPAVSFRSDRHRGPRGRRIPFLMWSTPFVGLFLILIGMYESITNAIIGSSGGVSILGVHLSTTAISLIVFGVLFVLYDFANIFVATVYWYLFNDVVPSRLLSQFLSFFRIVGTLAGIIYSKWVFPQALTHFRFLFVMAGIFYGVGFLIMCFMIREGNYPAPPPLAAKPTGRTERFLRQVKLGASGRWVDSLVAQMKTYAKECFTHRFYWYFFLQSTFFFVSWQAGSFGTIRNRDSLGLTLQQMGNLGAITAFVSLLLQWPAGWLSDRWNPIRVFMFTTFVTFGQNILQCMFIFTDFKPSTNLAILTLISFTVMPFSLLHAAAELPMYMRLLPKERYGQFCSANAMIRAFALIFGSFLAGFFLDSLKNWFGMGDFRYRFYPVWAVFFQIPAFIFLWLLYRQWKARGGDKGYVPPAA